MGGPRALGDGRRGVKGPQADWNMHTHAAGAVGSCQDPQRCQDLQNQLKPESIGRLRSRYQGAQMNVTPRGPKAGI